MFDISWIYAYRTKALFFHNDPNIQIIISGGGGVDSRLVLNYYYLSSWKKEKKDSLCIQIFEVFLDHFVLNARRIQSASLITINRYFVHCTSCVCWRSSGPQISLWIVVHCDQDLFLFLTNDMRQIFSC